MAGTPVRHGLQKAIDRAEIDAAIRAGKFSESRRAHYERLMAADPVGTRQLLAQLEPLAPAAEGGAVAAGVQPPTATSAPDDYPREWLGPHDRAERRQVGARIVRAED